MGWKEDARRTIVGEKIELKSFPGYFVVPRKYSVETQDKIREIQKQQQSDFNRRALAKIAKKMAGVGDAEKLKNMTTADIMTSLTDEEFESLYEITEQKTGHGAKLMIAKIAGGIAEHTFGDPPIPVEQLAKEVIEYAEIAGEIVEIADGFNRPLASQQSGTSEPSPSGYTEGDGSPQTATTSPTDETPGTC